MKRTKNGTETATYRFLVFAERCVDDAHIEENFGGIGDLVELVQRGLELIVVILRKGSDPGLYFLFPGVVSVGLLDESLGSERGGKVSLPV